MRETQVELSNSNLSELEIITCALRRGVTIETKIVVFRAWGFVPLKNIPGTKKARFKKTYISRPDPNFLDPNFLLISFKT